MPDPKETNPGEEIVVEPTPPVESFKSFATEDDFKKFVQSTDSKAKGDILKELGIKNVEEGKEFLNKSKEYDGLNTKYAELESRLTELNGKYTEAHGQLKTYEEDALIRDNNIPADFKSEFLTLVETKIASGSTKEEAVEKVVAQLTLIGAIKPSQVIIGNGGGGKKPTPDDEKDRLRKI